jgi:hypothetical protein
MFVEVLGPKDVDLRVNGFVRVGAQFDFAGNQVFNELFDSLLRRGIVIRLLNILYDFFDEYFSGSIGVREKQLTLGVVFLCQLVNVDPNKDSDLLDFVKKRPHLEVSGRTEISYQRIEILDAVHIGKHPFEFVEEAVAVLIGEEFGGHNCVVTFVCRRKLLAFDRLAKSLHTGHV